MRKHPGLFMALSLFVVSLPAIMLLGSCQDILGKRVQGNGSIKTEDRTLSNFRNVDVSGAYKIFISQGDQYSVKLEGDENLLQYVVVEKEGDRVIVRTRAGFNLNPSNDMHVYVTAPDFNRIRASGASDIIGQTKIKVEDLQMDVSGAGDIRMEVDAPRLRAEVTGSGNIDLKGNTKDVRLDLSGSGNAHCFELKAENTTVEISGAGDAEVFASVKLDAHISGAGSVSYKGNASVSEHVSGAGSIRKVD